MQHRQLPDIVYQALPYLYGGAGVLTIVSLQGGLAVASGLLLITAGALVWWVRRQHRLDGGHGGGMFTIRWRNSFASGHAVIDTQHRKLLELGNELVNKAVNGTSGSEVRAYLTYLLKHIAHHFSTEEQLLAEVGYPLRAEHGRIHRTLLARAEALAARCSEGQMPARELIDFVIHDLITDHLLKDDVDFFDTLRQVRAARQS